MIKKIKRWFYYRLARLSVRAKLVKNDKTDLTNIQKKIIEITLHSINDSDSELLINPMIDYQVGEKYYIKKYDVSGNVEKFITVSKMTNGCSIALIGHEIIDNEKHSYHFDVWFNEGFGSFIIGRFKRNLKRRRDKMEVEIRKDDEKTLELILKKSKNS